MQELTSPPKNTNHLFIKMILLSILLHFVFLFGISFFQEEKEKEEYIEVSLLKITPVPRKEIQIVKKNQNINPQTKQKKTNSIRKISAPLLLKSLKKQEFSVNKQAATRLGSDPLSFEENQDTNLSNNNLTKFERDHSGTYTLKDKNKGSRYTSNRNTLSSTLSNVSDQDKSFRRRGLAKDIRLKEKKDNVKKTYSNKGPKITGEAAYRKVDYKPPLPKIDTANTKTVSFKFTILPNGIVDQVEPLVKGNPKLEKLGIDYVKKYRFEPLFSSNKIQFGIISISVAR